MRAERSGNKLIIKETPGCLWLFGLFFALIGSVFVYGAIGGYSNFNDISPWVIAAHFFGGLCAIAAGYWIIYNAPLTRITIDRNTETVTQKTRGLSRRSDVVYRFDEIEQFRLIEKPDFDNDFVWSLGMELKDGELIEISAIQSPVESFKRDFVFQTNEFMYKSLTPYQAVLGSDEE